jgi:hypothetical protein
MSDLISIGEAVPQIIIAIGAVAIGLFVAAFILKKRNGAKSKPPPPDAAELVGQVTKLVSVLTDNNGELTPSSCPAVDECDGRFGKIEESLASHDKMHKRHFAKLRVLEVGQNDIYEHLTGRPLQRRKEDDTDDTGRHEAQD